MKKGGRSYACRRRMENLTNNMERPKLTQIQKSLEIPRRRRTRQSRRLREVTSWKKELTHFLPRASKRSNLERSNSSSCRYVKSKPPKRMPGGRIISSGQGTLTEVSRSFYVAYGATALNSETSQGINNINLVVPVRDELQEVADDELILDSSHSYQMPSEDSNKTDKEFKSPHHHHPPLKECELPIHDHPCLSMVLLNSPRVAQQCGSESMRSDSRSEVYRNPVQCGLASDDNDMNSITQFGSHLESSNSTQLLPMTWFAPQSSTINCCINPSPLKFEKPNLELSLPMAHVNNNDSCWYVNVTKKGLETAWDPQLTCRTRNQMSIQEACQYRRIGSERSYPPPPPPPPPSAGGYFSPLEPELSAACRRKGGDWNCMNLPTEADVTYNEQKQQQQQQEQKKIQELNKRKNLHHQHSSLISTRLSPIWTEAMLSTLQSSSDAYHLIHQDPPNVYLSNNSPHYGKASSRTSAVQPAPPCRVPELDPFNGVMKNPPSLRAYDANLCRQYVSGTANGNQDWTRNALLDYATLPTMLTTTDSHHFYPSNTNLLI
eukprot:g6195.t1